VDLVRGLRIVRRTGLGGRRAPDPLEGAAVPLDDGEDAALVPAQRLALAGLEIDEGQIADCSPWPGNLT